jgi:hypothetical protein
MASDSMTWTSAARIVAACAATIAITLWIVDRTETKPAELSAIPELRKDVTEIKVSLKGIETDMQWLVGDKHREKQVKSTMATLETP